MSPVARLLLRWRLRRIARLTVRVEATRALHDGTAMDHIRDVLRAQIDRDEAAIRALWVRIGQGIQP
jgi:hypothetical protein